jgi:hypothetical protein
VAVGRGQGSGFKGFGVHARAEQTGEVLTPHAPPAAQPAFHPSTPAGKAPTFGIKDDRSIKDQRESLPIFKLKDQLVQAVIDNQVRGREGCGRGTESSVAWGGAMRLRAMIDLAVPCSPSSALPWPSSTLA